MLGEPAEFRRPPFDPACNGVVNLFTTLSSSGFVRHNPPCDAGKVIQLYGPEGKVARHDPSSHP